MHSDKCLLTFCGLAYVPHSRNLILTTTLNCGITPNRCYVPFFIQIMTTKEKIINQSIEQVKKQLKEINFILEATPLSEICKIRQEAQKLLDENKTVEQRTSDDFITKIEALSKREKEQFALAEKSKDSIKLIDEKVKLEFELSDLRNELYHIERRRVS